MSMVINNNLMANNTSRILNNHYKELSSSIQKLSSGMRINSAADDAAGLAISELMRADIKSYQQGVRNANDAISLIQTADGAMQVIDEKLIRMKELAEQAATGTYDSVQRAIIDSEYQQMASEITRIAAATEFNNIKLLDGTLSGKTTDHDGSGLVSEGPLKVHFGPSNNSAEDYYYITIGEVSASALGLGNSSDDTVANAAGHDVSTQQNAQLALDAINAAIISKDNIRAHLGATQNRLENTISNLEIQAENLTASESRIRDVDVATEMTVFTKNQILTQSAVSMLAQANSMPQMASQLISG